VENRSGLMRFEAVPDRRAGSSRLLLDRVDFPIPRADLSDNCKIVANWGAYRPDVRRRRLIATGRSHSRRFCHGTKLEI